MMLCSSVSAILFLSTPSARRATSLPTAREQPYQFLSTPSARRATVALCHLVFSFCISIHALREEGDFQKTLPKMERTDFYPRPPRGGRRIDVIMLCTKLVISIHALREEGDCATFCGKPVESVISIHALREEGDYGVDGAKRYRNISIHALREEGDSWRKFTNTKTKGFLSTPSARRATQHKLSKGNGRHDFYPRPPRGGRQANRSLTAEACIFLSTPSARRATKTPKQEKSTKVISIHALREEGDLFA